ncbi:MAG: YhbY family RNA-binding protein [Negativicutes bacterium]|nr:YhbY family RNA-binding protein [Negativicutes bacterium]
MVSLTGKQRRFLRSMGVGLVPVTTIGREGLHGSAVDGVERALAARELIKVRVLKGCPLPAGVVLPDLAGRLRAELVQIVGRNGLLYRPAERDPQIGLPV